MRTARGGGADSSGEPALGRIDQYDLLRKLGGGGFGVVYLARDTVSGVRVALKTLHPLLKTNPEEMEALREKFALVARLTHQNVAKALVLHPCRMIDVWDETAKRELRLSSGDFVMVMDFAPGVTLTQWRRQFPGGRVPLSLALDVARQIAAALDYAHGEKIVHRDVKPGNVMVETVAAPPRPSDHGRARSPSAPTLRVRLLDFGLAAEIRSSMSRVSTETGDTSGTRPYMAPEQWLGRKQDGRTDQYALACVLYEMLSGAPPFAGVFETGDPVIMRTAVTTDPPEEIEGCDPAVNAALLRALAKDPKERFGSCSEFVENCLAQRPQGGGGLQTAVSKQGEAGSPGVLAPPDAPAQEAEVLRRKVLMARTLKSLPAEDRSDAGLSAFAEEADMELETAEEAFRYARFAAAAQCLDRADAALRKLAQAKAERKAREEAERRAREEAERKAREEAERKAREEAERKAREEAERKAREEAERKSREEARRKAREDAERKAREEAEREAKEKAKQETLGKILGKIVLAFFSFAAIGIGVKSCVDSATQSSFVSAVRRNHEQGKVQLWKGGPYWATKNIGAEKPEDFGLYFWWGDTVGYRYEGDAWVASDGSSRNFSFDARRSPTYGKDVATLRREGWTTAADVLAPEHDAAHVHWGGDWRMPTKQELDDLGSKCDWTWTTRNGVSGYLVRGQGAYVDASIFLPAAGGGYGPSLNGAGSDGNYWSSGPDESNSSSAWSLDFYSGSHSTSYYYRGYGRSVRPVQGFAK